MSDSASLGPQTLGPQTIDAIRAQIDGLDDSILDLVGKRAALARAVDAAKASQANGLPLRPAREIQLLRRLLAKTPANVDPDLVVELWRALIAANVRRQRPIEVLAAGATDAVRHFDCARRHFGGSTKIVRVDDARTAMGRVETQPGTVAVLPWPGGSGPGMWWPILAENRFRGLSIIAALPMRVDSGAEPEAAVVASGAVLEPAGQDVTFGLAFDPHYKVTRALNDARAVGREAGRVRETVLIQLEGFVQMEDARIAAMTRAGLEGFRIVGAYARL